MRQIAVLVLLLLLQFGGLSWAGESTLDRQTKTVGKLILDESGYFRQYIQFSPDMLDPGALKADGEKVLGAEYAPLEKLGKALGAGKDWADWREHVPVWNLSYLAQGTWNFDVALETHTAPPPADWMAFDFDDSAWMRQRYPFVFGNNPVYYEPRANGIQQREQLPVRRICHRASFVVPDTEKAGDYTLAFRYTGGVRVFLNGTELGRAHLPQGELKPDAYAEGYPEAAYLKLEGESPAGERANAQKMKSPDFCPLLVGRFEDPMADPQLKDPTMRALHVEHIPQNINRAGWERIGALRNRVWGPLPLPKAALKNGTNILAIEIVASRLHPVVLLGKIGRWPLSWEAGVTGAWGRSMNSYAEFYWPHGQLATLELRAANPAAPSSLERHAGTQVWVEDAHRRVFSADFEPGEERHARRTLRLVGARNGTFSAQVVIGSSSELEGLKATPGELKSPDAALPASTLRVYYPQAHPATELVQQGFHRCTPSELKSPLIATTEIALARYGLRQGGPIPRESKLKALEALDFFDHLASVPPEKIPAGRAQSVWISWTVPADAKPGIYKGTVTVEARGLPAVALPVVAEVTGWSVPDAKDFRVVAGLEQSPYGVAAQYKAPLWSDQHIALLESSFRQLARAGAPFLFVPVLCKTEFGNMDDTPIRWTRKADGAWTFDFKNLDRYLDVAIKTVGLPRVICFVVMHGPKDAEPYVQCLDDKSGKAERLNLDPKAAHYAAAWKAFAKALCAHMKTKHAEAQIYWGYPWDMVADPGLIKVLAEAAPGVRWSRGCHGVKPDKDFAVVTNVHGFGVGTKNLYGWRGKALYLFNYRLLNNVFTVEGHFPPYSFRLMADRALVAGARGFGRYGVDYWGETYLKGCAHIGWPPGVPCIRLLWPGKQGAESGIRYEMLLEGIQEAEARIFMEQAIDRKQLPDELAGRVQTALFENARETYYIAPGRLGNLGAEYCTGWQSRSHRLYTLAAEVAKASGKAP